MGSRPQRVFSLCKLGSARPVFSRIDLGWIQLHKADFENHMQNDKGMPLLRQEAKRWSHLRLEKDPF